MDFMIQDIGRKFLDKDGDVWELDMLDPEHNRIVFSRMTAGEASHIVTDSEGRYDGEQFITLRLQPLNMKQNYECGNYFADNKGQRWMCCEYNPCHDIYRMECISAKKRCWFLPTGFPHLVDAGNRVRLVSRVTQLPAEPEVGETVKVEGPTLIDITLGKVEAPKFTAEEERRLMEGDNATSAEFPGLHQTVNAMPEKFTDCVNLYLSKHGMDPHSTFLWKDFCNWMADTFPDQCSHWTDIDPVDAKPWTDGDYSIEHEENTTSPLDFDDEAIDMLPNRRAAGGPKYDGDKSMVQLLPPQAVLSVGDVLRFGAIKYEAHSWHKVDNADERYIGAGLRHILAHIDGEVFDSESGLPHLAHAICSLMFVLELLLREQQGRGKDGSRPHGE
jgi:hypothetical protein